MRGVNGGKQAWTLPAVLAGHAERLNASHDIVTLFTTGTDAGDFERELRFVGCVLHKQRNTETGEVSFFDKFRTNSERVSCFIPRAHMYACVGCVLSAAIRWDDIKRSETITTLGVTFPAASSHVMRVEIGGKYMAAGVLRSETVVRDLIGAKEDMVDLCAFVYVRGTEHLVRDHVEYHHMLGVKKTFLYVEEGVNVGKMDHVHEIVTWPYERAQSQACSHFMYHARGICRFALYTQPEMYIWVGASGKGVLSRYVDLRERQGYNQVIFPAIRMAGHLQYATTDEIAMVYRKRQRYQKEFTGIPIARCNVAWDSHLISWLPGGGVEAYKNVSIVPPTRLEDNAVALWYERRSWAEFVADAAAGGLSVFGLWRGSVKLRADRVQRWFLEEGVSEGGWDRFANVYRDLVPRRKWSRAEPQSVNWCRGIVTGGRWGQPHVACER